jgi:hypothetical protein
MSYPAAIFGIPTDDITASAAVAQAVLTVGAVAGAAWLQDRAITRRADERLRRELQSLFGLLLTGRAMVAGARETLIRVAPATHYQAPSSSGWTPLNERGFPERGPFREYQRVLDGVPVHQLPSWDLAHAVMLARTTMATAEKNCFAAIDRLKAGEVTPNLLGSELERFDLLLHGFASAAESVVSHPLGKLKGQLPRT